MTKSILPSLVKIHNKSKPIQTNKVPVYMRLNSSVIEFFKAQGAGYQARINDLLVDYVTLAQAEPASANRAVTETSGSSVKPEKKLELACLLFQKYHSQCFWHLRRDMEIGHEHIPIIVAGLRRHGGRSGFLEAAELCR